MAKSNFDQFILFRCREEARSDTTDILANGRRCPNLHFPTTAYTGDTVSRRKKWHAAKNTYPRPRRRNHTTRNCHIALRLGVVSNRQGTSSSDAWEARRSTNDALLTTIPRSEKDKAESRAFLALPHLLYATTAQA